MEPRSFITAFTNIARLDSKANIPSTKCTKIQFIPTENTLVFRYKGHLINTESDVNVQLYKTTLKSTVRLG